MAVYNIPLQNGIQTIPALGRTRAGHVFGFSANGTISSGQIDLIKAKAPGSDLFEDIPSSQTSLTNLASLLFTFPAEEYEITISGYSGNATELRITDTVVEV